MLLPPLEISPPLTGQPSESPKMPPQRLATAEHPFLFLAQWRRVCNSMLWPWRASCYCLCADKHERLLGLEIARAFPWCIRMQTIFLFRLDGCPSVVRRASCVVRVGRTPSKTPRHTASPQTQAMPAPPTSTPTTHTHTSTHPQHAKVKTLGRRPLPCKPMGRCCIPSLSSFQITGVPKIHAAYPRPSTPLPPHHSFSPLFVRLRRP